VASKIDSRAPLALATASRAPQRDRAASRAAAPWRRCCSTRWAPGASLPATHGRAADALWGLPPTHAAAPRRATPRRRGEPQECRVRVLDTDSYSASERLQVRRGGAAVCGAAAAVPGPPERAAAAAGAPRCAPACARPHPARPHGPTPPPQENCAGFVGAVDQLQATVGAYVAAVEHQAGRIEAEKLRAVGLRNRVAALHEVRGRRARTRAARRMGPSRRAGPRRSRQQGARPPARARARAARRPASPPDPRAAATPNRPARAARRRRRRAQERRTKRQELLQLLQERQEELDRLAAEEDSLRRVRQEQELMAAKLSDPAGPGLR
jgi:hypothetical protein